MGNAVLPDFVISVRLDKVGFGKNNSQDFSNKTHKLFSHVVSIGLKSPSPIWILYTESVLVLGLQF